MVKARCEWVSDDPISIQYHDEEWGNLNHFENDVYLFEMLTLEGAQAGLSWMTILKRREHYREAFCTFNVEEVAAFTEGDIAQLKQNKGIIRNERKIRSTIQNANAILKIKRQHGSFHQFLWEFVGGVPLINHWEHHDEVPASTVLSTELSIELKRQGFTFVGPVICYSFLQAIGLVQDHTKKCFLANNKE